MRLYTAPTATVRPFTCTYAGRLARARVSKKGVVILSALREVNLPGLAEMITAIEAGLASRQRTAR